MQVQSENFFSYLTFLFFESIKKYSAQNNFIRNEHWVFNIFLLMLISNLVNTEAGFYIWNKNRLST